MAKRQFAFLALALVVGTGAGYFLAPKPAAPLAPPFTNAAALSDAPALAARGPYKVGTTNLRFTHKDQPDLMGINPVTGNIPAKDRALDMIAWYPASLKAGEAEKASYSFTTPRSPVIPAESLPATMMADGHAARDASPDRTGGPYPLIVFSHGFRNFAAGFAQTMENIASKGYVVVAIEHRDAEPSATSPMALVFGNTVVTRAADQRFVIAELTARATASDNPLAGLYDPARIGLMGYSMGGFGALITMGAGFDAQGPLYPQIPGNLLAGEVAGAEPLRTGVPAGVKAMVGFAPWGAGDALRVWSPEGLAAVKVPSLLIVGDQDDVSGFDGGVHRIFDQMTGSDRRMLVYQGARHNIAGDGTPPQLAHYFSFVERYDEPVWRRDRILSVNVHFVTAFLDATLKGKADSAAYLNVPTVKAADGKWPDDKAPSSADYWPGFQRRWALGLELYHKSAGQ